MRSRESTKLFGFIPVRGVLHAQRDNVTRDYARILANDLFSPTCCPTRSCRCFSSGDKLSPAGYEAILRPVFKDDEMLMVMVGAVLGFLVGERQVVLVEQFAR